MHNIEVINENGEVSFNYDNSLFSISNKTTTFFEDSDKKKFIKNVEKLVRGTIEYRTLIQYIRENLEMDYCSILNNLDTSTVSIELHHTPYTLYDICEIVINKYEAENYVFNTLSIASEVLDLHYNNYIGLTPLSDTIHQLVHSEQIKIHKDQVIGKVEVFYSIYKDYMNEDHLSKYQDFINYSENNTNTFDPEMLYSSEKLLKQIEQTNKINNNLVLESGQF